MKVKDFVIYLKSSNTDGLVPIVGRKGGIIGLGLVQGKNFVVMSSFFTVLSSSLTKRESFSDAEILWIWKALRYLELNPFPQFTGTAISIASGSAQPDNETIDCIGRDNYLAIAKEEVPLHIREELKKIIIGEKEFTLYL